jgi:cytochrome d ubiquinol oxidase subunit I
MKIEYRRINHVTLAVPAGEHEKVRAFFVVLVNSWMNAPAGFDVINGPLVNINPIAALLNPASEEP